jgi:hypothetical protein
MTTLHDRLADLAEDSPPALPAPGLWDRGLRYRRRLRAAAAVVLAVAAVALVILGSATWLRSPSAVAPLPSDSPGGMPDHLYPGSGWLPGTAHAAPLGPIAALVPTVRHTWGGEESGVVGVSMTTGAYRFLDLPGLARNSGGPSWSLSPDGKYVAYVYAGSGDHVAPGAGSGVALYDASTGTVRRHVIPTDLGVRVSSYYWTGSGTVVVVWGHVTDRHGSGWVEDPRPLVWDVHVEGPHDLVDGPLVQGAGVGFVQARARNGWVWLDPGTGIVLRHLAHAVPTGAVDATGGRVAFAHLGAQRDDDGDRLVVRSIPSGSVRPTSSVVPGVQHPLRVYSWLDHDHVAALLLEGDPHEPTGPVVASVDVRTGQTRRLVTSDVDLVSSELATDLLDRPTVPGIVPARPLDPREVAVGVALVVLAVPVALTWWRRRVRP